MLSKFNRPFIVVILAAFIFSGVLIYTHHDRYVDLIVTVFGTFVAAWAGGWAAFSAERKTRDEAERNIRISSANKALFTIATMFNVFDNLRQFFIDHEDIRQSEDRAFLMDSPQPGMMQSLHFDFDSLNYFLDQDGELCSMALVELRVLDWHHQALLNTVELRAVAHDDLRKAVLSKNIPNLTHESLQTIFRAEYAKLAALTDQFIRQVDEGIATTKKMDNQMQIALQSIFPGQSFVQIRFAQKTLQSE
ncbi:hypothetical protein SAMN04515617_11913 [Collimonas sp. OK242]|uniref:hypothetical protein n=1 Tax=Collimonas sp. OK242 TaxID=1798195 RepID=UPI00089CE61E|nr:hypothetical protein [Collimonas sp. OK242]SDY67679.1 hypothetical protein SAMN04515617_11913 [Collimonas sp. OK242]